jgi:hypothetical protein
MARRSLGSPLRPVVWGERPVVQAVAGQRESPWVGADIFANTRIKSADGR